MARPLRIEFPGALYHVIPRGDGREGIYLEEDNRQAWLGILGAVCERFRWVCHAYCQMTNHYHLLVETLEANLSRGMSFRAATWPKSCTASFGNPQEQPYRFGGICRNTQTGTPEQSPFHPETVSCSSWYQHLIGSNPRKPASWLGHSGF